LDSRLMGAQCNCGGCEMFPTGKRQRAFLGLESSDGMGRDGRLNYTKQLLAKLRIVETDARMRMGRGEEKEKIAASPKAVATLARVRIYRGSLNHAKHIPTPHKF
jgi:hypothetical protein